MEQNTIGTTTQNIILTKRVPRNSIFRPKAGQTRAHDAAKHDTRQHADDKPVVFQKFHVISSLPMHLSGAGTMIARRAGVYVSYYMA